MKNLVLGIIGGIVIAATATVAAQFTDIANHGWAQPAINWAQSTGLIRGNGQSFRPADPVSRAELAVVMQRLEEHIKIGDAGFVCGVPGHCDNGVGYGAGSPLGEEPPVECVNGKTFTILEWRTEIDKYYLQPSRHYGKPRLLHGEKCN